eukprot:CAMPEP_0183442098 /NCGR_PEP_ID=MMETSP0370-20130417/86991_1 /TAXON_ID=268820 /ORGANISM="Peridinium aciculiferum, Strain PAER-2" /LENGTH=36 /DNA_ID= /DNA_START= /DNA_END= /DNA_ORIENTATION=
MGRNRPACHALQPSATLEHGPQFHDPLTSSRCVKSA